IFLSLFNPSPSHSLFLSLSLSFFNVSLLLFLCLLSLESIPILPSLYSVPIPPGLFSYREDYRPAAEPPSPQRSPEPWLEVSPSTRRDGSWFMQLLHTETKRMEAWCKEMEGEAEENDLSEEILGKIRSAVGSAQLLMSQKFQQFYWLCQQNLDPSAMPRPTSQDLAGFWDLLQLSIDDVTSKFDELQKIKSNNWRLIESPVKKVSLNWAAGLSNYGNNPGAA
uniref:Discs, large (Drosophila) homolog-associated protein 2b n=1 Tax=Pygocentrus nattereri TaxID=42514 RepID=A0AAR2LVU2_PYGNA